MPNDDITIIPDSRAVLQIGGFTTDVTFPILHNMKDTDNGLFVDAYWEMYAYLEVCLGLFNGEEKETRILLHTNNKTKIGLTAKGEGLKTQLHEPVVRPLTKEPIVSRVVWIPTGIVPVPFEVTIDLIFKSETAISLKGELDIIHVEYGANGSNGIVFDHNTNTPSFVSDVQEYKKKSGLLYDIFTNTEGIAFNNFLNNLEVEFALQNTSKVVAECEVTNWGRRIIATGMEADISVYLENSFGVNFNDAQFFAKGYLGLKPLERFSFTTYFKGNRKQYPKIDDVIDLRMQLYDFEFPLIGGKLEVEVK